MSENVILVTVDSLRADHCGFLGADRDLTPTLDAMAADGLVFEQAFAPGPRTPSSMPVVFTGEFVRQRDLGVYRSYDEKRSAHVERRARIRRHLDRFRTVPERFGALGYDTAGVTANPWTDAETNFDRGFDVFHAVQNSDVEPRSLPLGRAIGTLTDAGVDDWLLTWPDFYDLIIEARAELDEPYFLWVFLLDPHQPYFTPSRYREENSTPAMYYSNVRHSRFHGYTDPLPAHLETRLARAYRDTVRSVDAFVDRLLDDLADDDPTTVVHADHGESFHEHGTYGHRPQLYQENLHVPFLIHGAETTGRIETPVTLRDLPAYVTRAGSGGLDPTASARNFLLSRTEEAERTAVRTDDWTYISADETFADYLYDFQPAELYRTTVDPGETRNLIAEAEMAEPAALLRAVLDRFDAHGWECAAVSAAAETIPDDG
ncbi:sulfatase [Haloplanus pelagicus]|uniref:sulfatase n=1 Tax=Haloplanus pelagicus TaxID=2949995 RepID=UPI00203C26C3|nr:sulfatase [Haloplanus sp. HW8-1]